MAGKGLLACFLQNNGGVDPHRENDEPSTHGDLKAMSRKTGAKDALTAPENLSREGVHKSGNIRTASIDLGKLLWTT